MKDTVVAHIIKGEKTRQQNTIELIASENIVSNDVLEAQGSVLTNKYAEGYPGKRYYGGTEWVDKGERLAIERAKELFGAQHANVQPHSGSSANQAAYKALGLEPGDTVLGMNLNSGGHLTHGSNVSFSGTQYNFVSYDVDPITELLDYDNILALAKEHKPKVIVAGASAYSRAIDFEKFQGIAKTVGAKLMVDMAHIAGLVAAGEHMNPVPYADIVTTTTHKTLRGPRGGMILTNDPDLAKKIDFAIFPHFNGGPLEHVIIAKAVALGEAFDPSFKDYAKQTIKNAQAMASVFMENGFEVVSNGTDNHLFLLKLTGHDLTGKDIQIALDDVNIATNKNSIPYETLSPFLTSGIRIGTPAITTRGFKEDDAKVVANLIIEVINHLKKGTFDEGVKLSIKSSVKALTDKYPIYQ